MADGHVSFHWKDYRHHDKRKLMTLEAGEFIRRFLFRIASVRSRASSVRQPAILSCGTAQNPLHSLFGGRTFTDPVSEIPCSRCPANGMVCRASGCNTEKNGAGQFLTRLGFSAFSLFFP
jgi:hypothetical protein